MGKKKMSLEVSHSLDQDEALERMKALGDYWKNKYGATVDWSGNTGHAKVKYMMVKIDAEMDVRDGQVVVEGTDPGRLLRKKAIGYLRGKVEDYLDASKSVDDLPRS